MLPVERATELGSTPALSQPALGRRVWALTRPYFASPEKSAAWGLLIAIVALNLGSVYMAVLFNDWNKLFYDALQEKNATVFWQQLGRFTYLAFAFIVIAVYKFYLTQRLSMRWRAWMTLHYLQRWLSHAAFYQLELARFTTQPDTSQSDTNPTSASGANPDNPDQRIQEDINQFTELSISLTMGLLNAVVTLASFIGILWGLSGGFAFSVGETKIEIDIPGFMVWLAILYSLIGSVITHYMGRAQIGINFEQQRLEADFRHHMVRVREFSESIALDRGAPFERDQLKVRFNHVLGNLLQLILAQKRLVWFTSFFGQAAVIFPFLVAAPRFFSGAIQLGELMQISSAFGQVQGAMSWLVDNYNSLAAWRATTDRLTSFEHSFQSLNVVMARQTPDTPQAPSAQNLTIALPNGTLLLQGEKLTVSPGDHIGLLGPSGSGKSSVFRTLAGIWPFASGSVQLPQDSMFIPQRAYFPNGPLREALAYPELTASYTDEQMTDALLHAELVDLSAQLDRKDAWSQTLSGGEQQRLAIARVFLKQPRWIFADEATSALDTPTALRIYQRLLALAKRQQGAVVSIAHQSEIASLCTRYWTVSASAAGIANTGGADYRYVLVESPAPGGVEILA
jgi:putative ATP-binding cassette transporter